MATLTEKLHGLIEAYRISETPTDALALADFLVAQLSRPYLVEDCSDGAVYEWGTPTEAAEYATACIEAQHPPVGGNPYGVNHKVRRIMFIEEQTRWQSN
jgi:hypothetical protein